MNLKKANRLILMPFVFIIFVIQTGVASKTVSIKTPPQDVNRGLIGVWKDLETNGLTTIVESDGILVVTSVVDEDGEKFEVLESIWENGILKWSYKVNSTGYVLNMEVKNVSGDTMNCHWANATAEGMQEFSRVQ